MSEQKEQGRGEQLRTIIIGAAHHKTPTELRAIIKAQAAEIAELRAERDEWKEAATGHHPNPVDFRYWEGRYRDEKARALAAETALATAREALTEISNAPVPDSTSPARPSIGWLGFPGFKVIAQRALKTKEPSHG